MKIDLPEGREIDLPIAKLIWIPIVAVIVVAALTIFYQVDTEEEGVVLRFGKHVKTVGPGLHTKFPYPIDQVEKVRTRIVDVQEFGFRSGGGSGRQQAQQTTRGYEHESGMLTGDLNIVLAGWDVQFRRVAPTDFLFKVKDPEETLRDISQSVMREVMGDRASIPILTIGRAEIQALARRLIQDYADRFQMGIEISEVNLIFVQPPEQVIAAFNDLNKAEQDAVRFFEEASKEYQERVPRAHGAAERLVLEAEGFAERRINVARGDAQRFNDMLTAYEKSPEVTQRRLYLETMERMLPDLEDVIIIDENMKSLLPHLNLRNNHQQ
ncbi:MAG: FtsH protease activity modulator HflK [Opitutales bacterium]